jgi:hypothetical protein
MSALRKRSESISHTKYHIQCANPEQDFINFRSMDVKSQHRVVAYRLAISASPCWRCDAKMCAHSQMRCRLDIELGPVLYQNHAKYRLPPRMR